MKDLLIPKMTLGQYVKEYKDNEKVKNFVANTNTITLISLYDDFHLPKSYEPPIAVPKTITSKFLFYTHFRYALSYVELIADVTAVVSILLIPIFLLTNYQLVLAYFVILGTFLCLYKFWKGNTLAKTAMVQYAILSIITTLNALLPILDSKLQDQFSEILGFINITFLSAFGIAFGILVGGIFNSYLPFRTRHIFFYLSLYITFFSIAILISQEIYKEPNSPLQSLSQIKIYILTLCSYIGYLLNNAKIKKQ